jgi:asparagine synthetase B (glutamine-hydrolysing)
MERVVTDPHRRERRFYHAGRVVNGLGDLPRPLALDAGSLPTFLRLGYVPGTATLWEGVDLLPGGAEIEVGPHGWREVSRRSFAAEVDRARWVGAPRAVLVAEGVRLFREAVERAFDRKDPVVPLSGGLDSRAVLGVLSELVPASHVQTVSWGIPGGLDFELGGRVARAAGTRHLALDLGDVSFHPDRLREIAVLTDANTDLFQPVVWLALRAVYGADVAWWTGFAGDGVGGGFWQPDGPESAAMGRYLAHESRPLHWTLPGEVDDARDGALADRGRKYVGAMSSDEAVWFENHVERYTAHHLFPRGFDVRSPFMDDALMRFFFEIPPELRKDKALFDEILVASCPRLFALPTTGYGYKLAGAPLRHAAWKVGQLARKSLVRVVGGRWAVHPNVTYLDYATAIRRRPDLRASVHDALEALAGRGILDAARIRRLWREHLDGREHRYTLTLLASLEYMLQALAR